MHGGLHDLSAAARKRVVELGTELSPEVLQLTLAVYAPAHAGICADTRILSDLQYGPGERQTLNLFLPATLDAPAPIFLFVHGGGFVEGSPRLPGTPFYDNIGRWAAQNGMVGVVMGYRLFPEATWPAVTDDLETAIAWLKANPDLHRGDPDRVFVLGSSAGAIAVADFLGRLAGTPAERSISGAILRSGIYDLTALRDGPLLTSLSRYFGDDPAQRVARSPSAPLGKSRVPLLVLTAQYDPAAFHEQAHALVAALRGQGKSDVRHELLEGQNHFSVDFEINSSGDMIGVTLLEFVSKVGQSGNMTI